MGDDPEGETGGSAGKRCQRLSWRALEEKNQHGAYFCQSWAWKDQNQTRAYARPNPGDDLRIPGERVRRKIAPSKGCHSPVEHRSVRVEIFLKNDGPDPLGEKVKITSENHPGLEEAGNCTTFHSRWSPRKPGGRSCCERRTAGKIGSELTRDTRARVLGEYRWLSRKHPSMYDEIIPAKFVMNEERARARTVCEATVSGNV